ncbi:Uncharacterised protein [Helicobacter mustelae]|nr:Uncharacterised protein [Helicobacter mustelae]
MRCPKAGCLHDDFDVFAKSLKRDFLEELGWKG